MLHWQGSMNWPAITAETATPVRAELRDRPRFDRIAFGSGIAASFLFLIGAALFIATIGPRLPAVTAPVAERTAFFAEMSRSGVYHTISYLGEAQLGLLILFFGGLYGAVKRLEGESKAMSLAIFGAGAAIAVVTPLAILIEDHLMLGFAAAGVDPAIVASIDGLGPLSFALSGFPQAIVAGGTGLLLLRDSTMPRWLGGLGIAVGIMSLLGTATLMQTSMFLVSSVTILLFRVWMLALSVVLFRRA